jgi:hypothetical protein
VPCFGSADSKGFMGLFFVGADSKEFGDKTGCKTKTPAGCWRSGSGRDITQGTLYAGRYFLSREKVRKFAFGGAATEWQGKSQNTHPNKKGGAPALDPAAEDELAAPRNEKEK